MGQVGPRSLVRLLRASCSHEALTSKPDDDVDFKHMHEAKPVYSCVAPKADNSHVAGPLPK